VRPYLEIVQNLEKDILPTQTNFSWYSEETSAEIQRILSDIKDLLKYKEEIGDKQVKLQELNAFLLKTYRDYKSAQHTPPKDLTPEQLNGYLTQVAQWFRERYHIVEGNQLLRYIYRKIGCELLNFKRIEVTGAQVELKGPALLVSTHDTMMESSLFQALTPNHIFWVADSYLGSSTTIRMHRWPVFGRLLDALGMLEVNRKQPEDLQLYAKLASSTLRIFERGGIVGTFPLGSTEKSAGTWNLQSHAGSLVIVAHAEKILKIRIPIIPAGVRMDRFRFRVCFGAPFYLDYNKYNAAKEAYAMEIIDLLRKLKNA
jgi:hypothetical protein